MQKADPQQRKEHPQPTLRKESATTFSFPQGEQIAQFEAMFESSPQAEKQGGLVAMMNASTAMPAQRRLVDMIHNSPRQAAQKKLADGINNSPVMVAQRNKLDGLSGAVQRMDEEETLQSQFASEPFAQMERQRAENPNNTGLPDSLKSGIENLSGIHMDNVNVHYNSHRPAQINALAYAQGTDIHVAPGQEQHLPHEAWHVVQQAQGRVKPTMQMKDGVLVNDDEGLEREADAMGARAVQMKGGKTQAQPPLMTAIIQPATVNPPRAGSSQRESSVIQMITQMEFDGWIVRQVGKAISGGPPRFLQVSRDEAKGKFSAYARDEIQKAGLRLDAVDWDDMDDILRQYTFIDSRFGQKPKEGDHKVEQGYGGVHTDVKPNDAAYTVGLSPCVALGLILHQGGNSRVALAHFDSDTDVGASIELLLNKIGATPENVTSVQAFLAGGSGDDGRETFTAMDEELMKLKIGYIERHPGMGDVMNVRMDSDGMSGFK